MADKLKVLSGKIENLPSNIDPGSIYIALLNETTGEIYVDYTDEKGNKKRATISCTSRNKGTLTIGEYSYNGSEDVDVPVYKGNIT